MEHRDPDLDYVVVGYNEDTELPLGKLLRDDLCPIPGVVTQTMGLVDEIQHAPLRDLLCEAFTTRDAATGFWTCPASISDHHSYEGGLAHHSLEIATMVASASGKNEYRAIGAQPKHAGWFESPRSLEAQTCQAHTLSYL